MWSITKIFTFETAHRITNYVGLCNQIHGHSYELHVTLSAHELGPGDMLMDFKVLKTLVQEHVGVVLDHSLVLKKNMDNQALFNPSYFKIFWMETEPTAERLVEWMAGILIPLLPDKVSLRKLKLYETPTSYAEWENF
ncbi:MAG: 6-carboxytetrahydropterin synthase [Cyclobacteriaceae bacterium]